MIITIDGPAGSGKSAAALLLAERLDIPHLDTGAMYRAMALEALEKNLLDNPEGLATRAREVEFHFDWSRRPAQLYMDGRNIAELIRQPRVTNITYIAADNQVVRAELMRRQRLIGLEAGSLVTEGRDQGSIVFPEADFKFYLDAKPEERARRRISQMTGKGIQADYSQVLLGILDRDARDSARPVGGLRRTEGSILIDTTVFTLHQVVDEMYRIVTGVSA